MVSSAVVGLLSIQSGLLPVCDKKVQRKSPDLNDAIMYSELKINIEISGDHFPGL
jgi:hypothetical protein